MTYKLLAIDMDGTLLNSKNQVSDKTIDVLNKVRNSGVETVIATGRLLKSASYYAKKLGFSNPIITSNGALMVDSNGRIIYEKILSKDIIKKLDLLGDEYNIYHHFYTRENFFARSISKEILSFYDEGSSGNNIDIKVYKSEDELVRDGINIHKCLFVENNNKDKLETLSERLKDIVGINVTSSWHNNIEVMGEDVSKGNALKELCKIKDINPKEVIAIGDNENDLSMMEFAGYSIAMGNGVDLVKDYADYVTDTNDEDGLAKALEKIIL